MQCCSYDCLQYCWEWFRYICGNTWVKKHFQEENALLLLTNSWQGVMYSYPGGRNRDFLWQPGFNKKWHFALWEHDVILLTPSAFQPTIERILVKIMDHMNVRTFFNQPHQSSSHMTALVASIKEVSQSQQTEDLTIHVTAGCANCADYTCSQSFH